MLSSVIVVKLPGLAPPVTSVKKATVPLAFWNVIVLSAVGSTTVKVVSNASAVEPSNLILPCNSKWPPSVNLAYSPPLSPKTIFPSVAPLIARSPATVPFINALLPEANPINPLVDSVPPASSLENLIAGLPVLKWICAELLLCTVNGWFNVVDPIPTLFVLTSTNNVFESKFTSPANVTSPVTVAALIVGDVKVLFVNVCVPSNKVMLDVLDKSVEAIVMLALPSNDWPAIVLAVARVVAVSALPVTSPVILPVNVPAIAPVPVIVGDVNVLFVNVWVLVNNTISLVLDKSVEAIVILPVPSNDWPAIVLAVSKAVAVAALPLVSWLPEVLTPGRLIFALPSNDTPPIFLAVARAVAVSAFPVTSPVTLPVTFPSKFATSVPVVIVKLPVEAPVNEPVPTINLSVLSSQPINALSESPLSNTIPMSLPGVPVVPLPNSISLSEIVELVVASVVVVPFTVKLPVITALPPTDTLLLNVAAPASDMSKVKATTSEPPSLPLNDISPSLKRDLNTRSLVETATLP